MRKKSATFKLKKWIRDLRPLDWLIIGGIITTICVVGVFLVILIQPRGKIPALAQSSSDISSSSNVLEDEDYDKDAVVIDQTKFSGTVLDETKDAGKTYVNDTLFIGDSNTVRMMSYGHTTLGNDVGAVSMGIQHVLSKPIVFFVGYNDAVSVPKAVEIIQPKRIVITYGTNNTIGWTAKTFVDEYTRALKAIEKAYPYADIIINSIPPVDKIRENPSVTMQTIDAFNSALAAMAKKEGYKYLNSAQALKDEKHGFAKTDYTISDGLHLSKKGMDALFEYIRTHSYETEDSRPKPLKKVPARKETPPNIITEDPIFDRTQKTGIAIEFVNANGDMGHLEGNLNQTVGNGKACTAVWAVPKEGYAFGSWSCTVGSIEDTSNPSLTFTVPDTKEKTIKLTASFVKAGLSLKDSGGKSVSSVSLKAGDTFKVKVGFAPASYQHSKDFAASSNNSAVATVSADGTITAVGSGDATITFSALSGILKASIKVKVEKSDTSKPDSGGGSSGSNPEPDPVPSDPKPDPKPPDPVPSEPDPLPPDPVPSDPVPSDPVPSDPVPDSAPSEVSTPSEDAAAP